MLKFSLEEMKDMDIYSTDGRLLGTVVAAHCDPNDLKDPQLWLEHRGATRIIRFHDLVFREGRFVLKGRVATTDIKRVPADGRSKPRRSSSTSIKLDAKKKPEDSKEKDISVLEPPEQEEENGLPDLEV